MYDSGWQISILTCEKSDITVYSIFGHSALRIKNKDLGIDRIYNYGTFNPKAPGFYWDFVRGKAKYFVSRQDDINSFLYEYIAENRSVKEQILNIEQAKIYNLMDKLDQILQSDERYYYYDFIYNNCTTKLVEIIHNLTETNCLNKNELNSDRKTTLRKLISPYLADPVIKIGLNLIMGVKTDKQIESDVSLFLPDSLYQRIETAQLSDTKLMVEENTLSDISMPKKHYSLLYIYIWGVVLLLLILWKLNMPVYNKLIWVLTGTLGILLLIISIITKIDLIQYNINLLLINPLLLFFIRKRNQPVISVIIVASNIFYIIYSLLNGFFLSVMPVWLIISLSLFSKIEDLLILLPKRPAQNKKSGAKLPLSN